MVPWAHPSHVPSSLNRFSRFQWLTYVSNRQAHRQTDRPRYAVCSKRPHLMHVMRPNNNWSKNFVESPHRRSCRCWGLNDPICCVHRSRDSQCFSVDRTTPKIAPSRGGSRPHLIYGSCAHPSLPSNQHLDRFSYFCRAHERVRQTDTQTTLLRL